MDNLEKLSEPKNNKPSNLITAAELQALLNDPDYRKMWEERNSVECPKCHRSYNSRILVHEPFRTIVEDASNTMRVCEDCYWKWVGKDITRYFSDIEETPEGFCYVKELA